MVHIDLSNRTIEKLKQLKPELKPLLEDRIPTRNCDFYRMAKTLSYDILINYLIEEFLKKKAD